MYFFTKFATTLIASRHEIGVSTPTKIKTLNAFPFLPAVPGTENSRWQIRSAESLQMKFFLELDETSKSCSDLHGSLVFEV